VICELIDQPHHGVMALMDEACLNVGNTTDQVSVLKNVIFSSVLPSLARDFRLA
jgi:hypothetical protein